MTHGRFPEDQRLPPEVVPDSTLIRKDPRSRRIVLAREP